MHEINNMKENWTEEIKRVKISISQSLEGGFFLLEEYLVKAKDSNHLDTFLQIKGRHNSLIQKKLKGIISDEYLTIEENKISNDLLIFVSGLSYDINKKTDNREQTWLEKELVGHTAIAEYVYSETKYTIEFYEVIKLIEDEESLLFEILWVVADSEERGRRPKRNIELTKICFSLIENISCKKTDSLPEDKYGNSIDRYPSKLESTELRISYVNGQVADKKKEFILIFNSNKQAQNVFKYIEERRKL